MSKFTHPHSSTYQEKQNEKRSGRPSLRFDYASFLGWFSLGIRLSVGIRIETEETIQSQEAGRKKLQPSPMGPPVEDADSSFFSFLGDQYEYVLLFKTENQELGTMA